MLIENPEDKNTLKLKSDYIPDFAWNKEKRQHCIPEMKPTNNALL
jgi:hypothetical protein